MAANKDRPTAWAADIAASVNMYNAWFMQAAPATYATARQGGVGAVTLALQATQNLRSITAAALAQQPGILSVLRMACCPPLAVDRLVGLSGASPSLVKSMTDDERLPARMRDAALQSNLDRICVTLRTLLDAHLCPWVAQNTNPNAAELDRAREIIADRLSGALANPIIRNSQETRQLQVVGDWLRARGYQQTGGGFTMHTMPVGTYAFRLNVPVGTGGDVQIPVDVVIMPRTATPGSLPLLIEAKSAGDFTNVNKRRKEEAQKANQLRARYGPAVQFHLFLCGYFNEGYLTYEADEGIDWVWEHRPDDLALLGA